jgi:hypothetical protein
VPASPSRHRPDATRARHPTPRVEENIRTDVPHIERVLIHTEPAAPTHICYAVPLSDRTGTISQHLGEAPFFALVTVHRDGGDIEEHRACAGAPMMTDVPGDIADPRLAGMGRRRIA